MSVRRLFVTALLLTVGGRAWGQAVGGQAAVQDSVGGATTLPARPTVAFANQARAETWYRRAFDVPGKPPLDAVGINRLYAAHVRVEEYFGDIPTSRRESLVREIERSGTTPNEVAELCRIRLSWQDVEPGVYYVSGNVGPVPVRYFVGVPKGYRAGTPTPLVLMLPTASAFAVKTNGKGVYLGPTVQQVADTYTTWLKQELATRPGNLVVMPLLHLTDLWGPGYAGLNNAIKPLQDACERFSVDVGRVYLRGQGMSGHAVWNLGLLYPTYFAAVNPLAGGASYDWQRMRAINLRNTLPVVWHDADDPAVPVKASRDMVALLRRNKIDVLYEETKGLGHTPGNEVDARLYARMIARTREPNPREVKLRNNRPDIAFNRVDWVQVWQPLDPGDEVRQIFRWSGTGMWTYGNPVTVEARLSPGNRIDLDARNLGTARLLLDDSMVDFSKPVRVTVNQKVVFDAAVRPTVGATLSDQLLLGRGWRKYTAGIDLDLFPSSTGPATAPVTSPVGRASTRPAGRATER